MALACSLGHGLPHHCKFQAWKTLASRGLSIMVKSYYYPIILAHILDFTCFFHVFTILCLCQIVNGHRNEKQITIHVLNDTYTDSILASTNIWIHIYLFICTYVIFTDSINNIYIYIVQNAIYYSYKIYLWLLNIFSNIVTIKYSTIK